jgi:hypothetical protein
LNLQGRVAFATSTRRPSMMRRAPFGGSSRTAQPRCSSRIRPPLIAHNRPAPPRCSRGRWRRQPNKATASHPSSAARSAQFSLEVRKLLQSPNNWCHRCAGISAGWRWSFKPATPSIQLEGTRETTTDDGAVTGGAGVVTGGAGGFSNSQSHSPATRSSVECVADFAVPRRDLTKSARRRHEICPIGAQCAWWRSSSAPTARPSFLWHRRAGSFGLRPRRFGGLGDYGPWA